MALSLEGFKGWPDRPTLVRLGQLRCGLSLPGIEAILEATADALADTAPAMAHYFKQSELETGERIRTAWESGIRDTLGLSRGLTPMRAQARAHATREFDRPFNALLLKFLRAHGGAIVGAQNSIADSIVVPPTTLSSAIKRLVNRGLLFKGKRSLQLLEREV